MANLVKLTDPRLYVGFTPNAANCYAAMQALSTANVPYTLMAYNDPAQHEGVYQAISTWTFGLPNNAAQMSITNFPFLTWNEAYDDYSTCVQIAYDSPAIANSTPITQKALIG